MTQISHPHTGQPTASEAQWRQMGRLFTGTGVVDDVADQLEPSADGTSLETTVAAGRCFVDGFLLDSSEPVKLAHEAAHPTQDRVDLVVARYDPDFSAEGDGRVRLAVHAGVAGDGTPDPTQDPGGVWELVLAEVTVRGGAGTVVEGDVTDRRAYIGSVRDRAGTTAERDAYAAEIGDWWWNTDTVVAERWDGAEWQPLFKAVDVQIFTASGTWTKRVGARLVLVDVIGAGGGSGGSGTNVNGSGGGGGGARRREWISADELGPTEDVTVGAGGAAGAADSSSAGGAGGASTFAHVYAGGGAGGAGASSRSGGRGGAAGTHSRFLSTPAGVNPMSWGAQPGAGNAGYAEDGGAGGGQGGGSSNGVAGGESLRGGGGGGGAAGGDGFTPGLGGQSHDSSIGSGGDGGGPGQIGQPGGVPGGGAGGSSRSAAAGQDRPGSVGARGEVRVYTFF